METAKLGRRGSWDQVLKSPINPGKEFFLPQREKLFKQLFDEIYSFESPAKMHLMHIRGFNQNLASDFLLRDGTDLRMGQKE